MNNSANSGLSIQRGLARMLAIVLALAPVLAEAQAPQAPAPATPAPAAPAPSGQAPPAAAPTGAPQAAQPQAPLPVVQGLKIVPLAGRGEMNDLERRVMAPLVVEVLDQNDRPVEGADVVFRFPINGPGATFSGGRTSQTVHTNGQGQAAAMNWNANNQVGQFDVHVTATYGNQVGEATVSMSNVTRIVEEPAKKRKATSWWSSKRVRYAVLGGTAALVAGVVLATRGGGSKGGSTITITAGPPTVGGPH